MTAIHPRLAPSAQKRYQPLRDGSHLGLNNPPNNRFEMCVPDARFLCNAELTGRFMIPDTPVAGYIFESDLGHPVGWFMGS